jgi:hypothetical protein
MSRILTPVSIAEHALREIGATYWHETGAEAPKMRIALARLDMVLDEIAGTEHLNHLVPIQLSYPLVAEQAEYDLQSTVTPDVWMVRRATLIVSGVEQELTLYRRIEWDALDDRLTREGRPEGLYIEQSAAGTMRPYPIPDDDYTLSMTVQQAPIDATENDGRLPHNWPVAWQRYLALATAYDCGRGPIAQLPGDELRRLRDDRDDAKFRLLARSRKENVARPRHVAYRDF